MGTSDDLYNSTVGQLFGNTGSGGGGGEYSNWLNPFALDHLGLMPGDDQNNANKDQSRQGLNDQSAAAGGFADQAQQNYGNMTGRLNGSMDYLTGLMHGQNSVSAEQLRQGNQQGLAQQRSLAASASPQNSAMAARTAAMQMGRLNSGLSGQQALAGLQERNMAANQLGQLQLGARGQDVSAANGARGNAIQGYGSSLNGPGDKSWWEKNAGALGTAVKAM